MFLTSNIPLKQQYFATFFRASLKHVQYYTNSLCDVVDHIISHIEVYEVVLSQ